ncbi:hypothetical protein [Chelatococcus reniformis]|uniref:Lipoprotein n=1 Tax=Chelatococcus reniformis TaxID=1494448 RepID=A0A916UYB1_9HYPH|nr:hypothetical protein [Chelatococcus reniformis]GGC93246.1 hypothetical protein GCM10010994_58830 [Chelatococcus reniformis]
MKLTALAATAVCALVLAACDPARIDASVSSTAGKAAAACPYAAIAATTGNAKVQSAAAKVAPAVITTCTALQAGQVVDVQSCAAVLNAYGSLLAAGAAATKA